MIFESGNIENYVTGFYRIRHVLRNGTDDSEQTVVIPFEVLEE